MYRARPLPPLRKSVVDAAWSNRLNELAQYETACVELSVHRPQDKTSRKAYLSSVFTLLVCSRHSLVVHADRLFVVLNRPEHTLARIQAVLNPSVPDTSSGRMNNFFPSQQASFLQRYTGSTIISSSRA